jgi:hypothetical protein
VRTDALNLKAVIERFEAVLGREPVDPPAELAFVELDNAVAVATDEMVVMHVAAEAVAQLGAMMR